jgi:ribosomal protein S27E
MSGSVQNTRGTGRCPECKLMGVFFARPEQGVGTCAYCEAEVRL